MATGRKPTHALVRLSRRELEVMKILVDRWVLVYHDKTGYGIGITPEAIETHRAAGRKFEKALRAVAKESK